MRLYPTRLGPKLNVTLLAFLLLLGAATAALIFLGFRRTQDTATQESRRGLEEQGQQLLLQYSEAQSSFGSVALSGTGGLGERAAQIFAELQRNGDPPLPAGALTTGPQGERFDARADRRTDVLVPPGVPDSDAVARDVRDSAAFDAIFPALLAQSTSTLIEDNFNGIAIYFNGVSGVTRYYPPIGLQDRVAAPTDTALLMRRAGPEQNPGRTTVWSAPHEDGFGQGLILTASAPVYAGAEFRGVISIDLSMAKLIAQVDGVPVTANGFAFYLDSEGSLLQTDSARQVQAELDDPANVAFADTITRMRAGQSGVDRVHLDGLDMFVAYTPIFEVGGNFAVVAPVDEISEEAASAVQDSIESGGNRTIAVTLATMAAFFIVALVTTAWLSRRTLLRPIQSIVDGTRSVAAGDLSVQIPVRSADELGILADSFNAMTRELSHAREQVDEEQQRWQRSEAELRALFAAMQDVIVVLDRAGKVVRVAPTSPSSFPLPAAEMVGMGLDDVVTADQAQEYVALIARALDTQQTESAEYSVRIRDRDRWFAASISPMPDDTVIWVARDVTSRKAAEQVLTSRAQLSQLGEQVGAALSRGDDFPVMLRGCTEALVNNLGLALARVWVVGGDGGELELLASSGLYTHLDGEYGRIQMGKGVVGIIASDRRPYVSHNPQEDPAFDEPAWAARDGIASFAGYPMIVEGDLVGVMAVFAREQLPEPVLSSLGALSSEIAIGIKREQAEVALRQAQESLEMRVEERTRELAALLDISADISSTLELQPLLGVILKRMHALVPTDRSAFLLMEDDELVVREVWGTPDGMEGQLGLHVPLRLVPLWDRVGAGQTVIVDDVRGDSENARSFQRTVGPAIDTMYRFITSWMAAPLIVQDRVIGMLGFTAEAAGAYTDRDAQLATAIASQAAVAVENARLYEQTQQRTRELTTLLDVSRNVTSTIELNPLLRLILEQVRNVADYDRSAFISFDGDLMNLLAMVEAPGITGGTPGFRTGAPLHASRATVLLDQLRRGEPVLIDDVRSDGPLAESYRGLVGDELTGALSSVRNWMGVPLMQGDEIVGALTMSHHDPGHFTQRQAQLVAAVANQAAVTLENARLYQDVKERTRELSALLEVSHTVASTLDLQSLMNVILDQMKLLIDYTGSTLLLLDGEDLVIMDARSPSGREQIIGARFSPQQTARIWERISRLESVVIDDVLADDELAEAYRFIVDGRVDVEPFRHTRAWMAVPIALQDRVIGALTLSHIEPGYFGARHTLLARAIADQAAVAVENARLFQQSEEHTRELATLLDVSRNVTSTIELKPLLALILEQVRNVADYDRAAFLAFSGDAMSLLAMVEGPRVTGSAPVMRPDEPQPVGLAPELLAELRLGSPVVIDDLDADTPRAEAYRRFAETRPKGQLRSFRNWMGVPMMQGDRVVGALTMSHRDPGHFTARQAQLVCGVASQAAIALENAQLFQSVKERTRELSVLLEVSHTVASTLDLPELVNLILDQLRIVIDCTGSSIMLDEGDALVLLDARSVASTEEMLDMRFPIDVIAPIWDVVKRREPVIINDVRDPDDPMAVSYRRIAGEELLRTNFRYISSWMGVPLALKDRVIGVLTMSHTDAGYFDDRHAELARAIADQAAIAIENARLYEQAQELAAHEERQRLARELHDSVSQALYGVALGARTARTLLDRDPAKAIEPVEYVLSLAEAGLAEMRALIFELRPESLELEGLRVAIEKQAASLRARHHVEVDADLCDEPDVPLKIKEGISRIAQEAMHNTVKHARASHVAVRLICTPDEITFDMRDNGSGFDTDGTFAGHLGLRSMRERATKLGGTLRIESAPGAGTHVVATIPLNARGAG